MLKRIPKFSPSESVVDKIFCLRRKTFHDPNEDSKYRTESKKEITTKKNYLSE